MNFLSLAPALQQQALSFESAADVMLPSALLNDVPSSFLRLFIRSFELCCFLVKAYFFAIIMFKERRGKNQSTHPEQQQSDKLVVTVVKIYITTKLLSISIYKKGLRFEWWWIREWRMTSANNNMLVLKGVWFWRSSFEWKNRNSFQKRIWLDPNSSFAFWFYWQSFVEY